MSEKIAVLAGGSSCEREISLISGRAVFEALTARGFETLFVDPDEDLIVRLKAWGATVAFLALHGSFGEDGTVQRALDSAGVLYTGSSAEASAKAFDKSTAQRLFQTEGLSVPAACFLRRGQRIPDPSDKEFPLVVKPAACGSSVGISLVPSGKELASACAEAFRFSETILIERYIRGRELTVGILGGMALPLVEIITPRGFYDYQAKYQDPATRYESPTKLTSAETALLQDLALKAFHVLGCDVMARVDFILGQDGIPYLLEVNTIPGLTGKSLLPKAAKAAGIDFPDLCVRILQLSLERTAPGKAKQNGQTAQKQV